MVISLLWLYGLILWTPKPVGLNYDSGYMHIFILMFYELKITGMDDEDI